MNSAEMWTLIGMNARESRHWPAHVADMAKTLGAKLVTATPMDATRLKQTLGVDALALPDLASPQVGEEIRNGLYLWFPAQTVAFLALAYEGQLAILSAERKKLLSENRALKDRIDEMK
jgi:hypothetical protein